LRRNKENDAELKGKCNLCGGIYSKAEMGKHLKVCMRQEKSSVRETGRKRNAFHIFVEGADNPEYWMHLEADADATLEDLDAFLRSTWLECCGHMSAFTINKTRYIAGSGIDAMWVNLGIVEGGDSDMNIALSKVLAPRLKFYHEYDFGSTTELVLKVLSAHETTANGKPVRILARNEPPKILCDVCGKTATKVCPQCVDKGKGWLCDKCARKHKCGEDFLLPVVNSPRVGVCGYTGEESGDDIL